MPESVKRRGSSGPTIGATVRRSTSSSVAMPPRLPAGGPAPVDLQAVVDARAQALGAGRPRHVAGEHQRAGRLGEEIDCREVLLGDVLFTQAVLQDVED